MSAPSKTARIRELNDAMRRQGHSGKAGARWLVTDGVLALGETAATSALTSVRDYTDFNADNDPHGEHDFGAFDLEGHRVFWKIDYYDASETFGSEDPADPDVTRRVLTILLANEY